MPFKLFEFGSSETSGQFGHSRDEVPPTEEEGKTEARIGERVFGASPR